MTGAGISLTDPTHAGPGDATLRRTRFVVTGLVQGVGFRPFVARLAGELGISGWCSNTDVNVIIEAVGTLTALREFDIKLVTEAPVMARVLSVRRHDLPVIEPEPGFRIVASSSGTGGRTLVAPDTAICDDCLTDLRDPTNRRYRHPFVTCTNCGPRFTITLDLPYDRPATTMADFEMCAACRAEYLDPNDRSAVINAGRGCTSTTPTPHRWRCQPKRRCGLFVTTWPPVGSWPSRASAACIWPATPPTRRLCSGCGSENADRTSRSR
jgi:acylphosphatase